MRRIALAVVFATSVATAAPLDVSVLSTIDGSGKPPDATEKLVKLGATVTLHAVVRGAGLPIVADAPQVKLAGVVKPATSPERAGGPWTVRWYRVEATDRALSNTDPEFHWHEIGYRDVELEACRDRFHCAADLHTAVLGDRGGLGTMAFKATVTRGDRSGSSVGSEKRHRGGLIPEIARVTVRRDDTYLGYLTELFNTPYIWGSAGSDRVHQAERRIGSDCADLMTYGVRRLGHDVPYTSTWQLGTYTRRLATSDGPDADGVYRQGGRPIAIGPGGVRPGDMLLFPGHVGALVRDEAPLGVLSTSDVMMHTSWREPEEKPLAETEYARSSVKVVRWKVLDR